MWEYALLGLSVKLHSKIICSDDDPVTVFVNQLEKQCLDSKNFLPLEFIV